MRRELVNQDWNVVATFGDQHSDFYGGHTGLTVKLPNFAYVIE